MARLRQIHPGNYRSSDRINDELEQVIRYINSAELGNKTLAELMRVLFDGDGTFRGPVEMRLDDSGLQYRIGTYTDSEDGWLPVAEIDELRGPPGRDFGAIGGPLLYARADIATTNGQTVFSYPHVASDDVFAFKNGVLQAQSLYSHSAGAGTVTFTQSPYNSPGDTLTLFRVRKSQVEAFRRSDLTAAPGQAVFPFSHTEDEVLQVYKNGVLMRRGGSFDYINDPISATVTFMSPTQVNDLISIITVEDKALTTVAGLMTEDRYTDANGLIPWTRLLVADSQIPQSKVNGLATILNGTFPTVVGPSAPPNPNAGWMWIDTTASPNILKFWNGTAWLRTSPATAVPDYTNVNALQILRVSANGTALEWSSVDLSSRIPMSFLAAANGVATLDAQGMLPFAQLPDIFSLESFQLVKAGAVTNATYDVRRIYKQRVRIDAISRKLSAGSADIKITVGGVEVGSLYSTTATLQESNLASSIEIDATAASKTIGVKVTNATSAADLDVVLAIAAVAA